MRQGAEDLDDGWKADGLCHRSPVAHIWFSFDRDDILEAIDVCGECPVKGQCTNEALHGPIKPSGVWGGVYYRDGAVHKIPKRKGGKGGKAHPGKERAA